jgi:hypothetical protein
MVATLSVVIRLLVDALAVGGQTALVVSKELALLGLAQNLVSLLIGCICHLKVRAYRGPCAACVSVDVLNPVLVQKLLLQCFQGFHSSLG